MLLVHQIRLPIQRPAKDAVEAAAKKLGVLPRDVAQADIHKISVDARRTTPMFVYSIALRLKNEAAEPKLERLPDIQLVNNAPLQVARGTAALPGPVVVCGGGPAGLFAALELAAAGFAPLVIERGPNMETRRKAVEEFNAGGPLLPDANIQFGEGGAGTFSDGKLTTRIRDPLCQKVTRYLLDAGAPPDIGVRAKPHIGTDLLQGVLVALRQKLLAMGGRVLFNTKLTGLVQNGGRLCAVKTTQGEMPCGALVLAVGHSARDTFASLLRDGLALQPKPFAVGLRIEHLQHDIDEALYHGAAGHPLLPAGEYQLAATVAGRGVYTFCMCPGGNVVAAASEEGGVVTNGMSLHARGGANANAAVVAQVDATWADPMEGVEFQRNIEKAAFAATGGGYAAPAQTVQGFLGGRPLLTPRGVEPSYPKGVAPYDLNTLFPAEISGALQQGIQAFGKKLRGFSAPGAVLTGPETRTSSPVRMPRGETLESTSVPGVWPCGEGAGYAGGIMSAATDGLRVAQAIIGNYMPL